MFLDATSKKDICVIIMLHGRMSLAVSFTFRSDFNHNSWALLDKYFTIPYLYNKVLYRPYANQYFLSLAISNTMLSKLYIVNIEFLKTLIIRINSRENTTQVEFLSLWCLTIFMQIRVFMLDWLSICVKWAFGCQYLSNYFKL